MCIPLLENCPCSEFFGPYFLAFRLNTVRLSPHSVRMRENTYQKNFEYGHFLRSVHFKCSEQLFQFFNADILPANIYLFKFNNRNTRKRCQKCSKLKIKTPERRHWNRSGVFIVNFEHISHLFLLFLLIILNK